MAKAEFFARFGFRIARNFLGEETRARLRDEVREAVGTPATVHRGGVGEVDERVRRVNCAHVSPTAGALVGSYLQGIMPDLARHFGMALSTYEDPSFLRYRPGDFYVAHRDTLDDPGDDPSLRERKVSIVGFLNGEGEASDPAAYGGGVLMFGGLLADPRLRAMGIPLVGEPGLLIAFRSDILHAVTPLTFGERYTIVSWFS